ncbi:MAG: VanZ family protein [Gimesia sp.]
MNRYESLIRTGLILYWALMFTATHIPLQKGTLPQGTDIPLHFIAYAGLSFLVIWWLSFQWDILSPKLLIMVLVGISFYGVLDELIQGIPVLRRQPSLDDWVADTLGALLGIVFFLLIRKPCQRLFNRFQKDDHPS